MIAHAPISGVLPLYRSLVRSPPGKGKETAATQAIALQDLPTKRDGAT